MIITIRAWRPRGIGSIAPEVRDVSFFVMPDGELYAIADISGETVMVPFDEWEDYDIEVPYVDDDLDDWEPYEDDD